MEPDHIQQQSAQRGRGRRAARAAALALLGLASIHASAAPPEFKSPIDGQPIETPLKPGETQTPALKQFKQTGTNPYRKDPQAIQAGKALYEQWCQVCHNADAKGKMGPALIGANHIYPQTATDTGMFAIIYGGALGAMQAFSKRELTQDEMLKIIAYVRSLDEKR